MTQARLVTTPPEGHGITGRMLDKLYAELTSGRNMGENMLVVGIISPVSTSQRRTAKGVKRFVGFEFLRLEPITDMAVAEEVRFALVQAYERRTSGAKQLPLEFEGATELEKRREIFAALDEWRADQTVEVTPGELTDMWRDYIQPAEGAAVPAMVHAPTQNVLEFAYHIGALLPEKLAGMEAIPTDTGPQAVRPVPEAMFDDGTGEQGEPGDAGELSGDTGDGGEADGIDAAAAEAAGTCEVCMRVPPVVDGLCAGCAKTNGIPVPEAAQTDEPVEPAADEPGGVAADAKGEKKKLRAVN